MMQSLSEATAVRLFNSVVATAQNGGPPALVPPIPPVAAVEEHKSLDSVHSANEFGNSCRICRWNRSDMQILRCPCRCKGSVGFVHLQCLRRWIMHRRDARCEICNVPFEMPEEHLSVRRMVKSFFCTRCIGAIAKHLLYSASLLPLAHVVLQQMSQTEHLKDMLLEQLSDLEVFERLLRFDPARQQLFQCLTALMSSNKPLATQLQLSFTARYNLPKTQKNTKYNETMSSTSISSSTDTADTDLTIEGPCSLETAAETDYCQADFDDLSAEPFNIDAIEFGLRLGSFLSEAGWLSESIQILTCVARRLKTAEQNPAALLVRLDCLQRLLHSEAALCSFKSAERTFTEMVNILKQVCTEYIPKCLLANLYTQFSAMFFARSEYDDSHTWSVVAMRQLTSSTPEKIAIDVLRQAAKACVVKRDFQRANMLICQATRRARLVFGKHHQKFADTLLDYGFFLLNVDSVYQSVKVYQEALEIKRFVFGNRNFHVAIAHEDLSYAFYVHEYSTGNFDCAREHVEKAVDIMKDLVPSDHLMLASAKRVKALLLEEIALDKMASEGDDEEGLLKQSEDLHKFALELSLEVFGEINVQTAKHYGNLGRLYQTMNRFEEAERMHQKAIKIKTDLLGAYDYEVGLSIGHLASLYNYQMKKYRKAEDLYLRSIEISLRLFGRAYSGLEYDYLGLCHVYESLREFEKYLKYATILESWQALRGENNIRNKATYPEICDESSLEEVKKQFFDMCTQKVTTPFAT